MEEVNWDYVDFIASKIRFHAKYYQVAKYSCYGKKKFLELIGESGYQTLF